MITLNQNQFVALTMEELVNTFGGADPVTWAETMKKWINAVGDVLIEAAKVAGAVLLAAAGLSYIAQDLTNKN